MSSLCGYLNGITGRGCVHLSCGFQHEMTVTKARDNMVLFVFLNPLRTDGDFCHQGQDTEIAPKHSDSQKLLTYLKEHFLAIPLVFQLYNFQGKKAFSEFFSPKISP
jgi:hypothetical protein